MMVKKLFPKGILHQELFMGTVNYISANSVEVVLGKCDYTGGQYFMSGRYGKGEVGEFVVVEGQINLVLGRIVEVKDTITQRSEAIVKVRLLGSICMESLKISAGVEAYPRLNDKVYSAPHKLIAMIPELMDDKGDDEVVLNIGSVDVASESSVNVKPEKLFGRHLAILGSTGGGKSWTTAKIIEECLNYNSKMILLDATGEYRDMIHDNVLHIHLGTPIEANKSSCECALPPISFQESDFIALFEPSGKVQGPKLRDAIKSLRVAQISPHIYTEGLVRKIGQPKQFYSKSMTDNSSIINNPRCPFNVMKLCDQIREECVYPTGFLSSRQPDHTKWGGADDGSYAYCLSLITRINGFISSPVFESVFNSDGKDSLTDRVKKFIEGKDKLLRIDLSGIPFENKAREIISNAIGRYLLTGYRNRVFSFPSIVFLDEAHNFLGKTIGSEDAVAKLDAFENIAREGRKFGLNVCFATQRPRDITEGVLSQIGTMIVHRLTNDRDRDIVERACGEIDKAASAFLPSLKQGEAAIIGTDFPIPLTVQISKPNTPPKSSGADFQNSWKVDETRSIES